MDVMPVRTNDGHVAANLLGRLHVAVAAVLANDSQLAVVALARFEGRLEHLLVGDYRLAAIGVTPADQHPANMSRHEVAVTPGEGDVLHGLVPVKNG
jgi:hypothetical protein